MTKVLPRDNEMHPDGYENLPLDTKRYQGNGSMLSLPERDGQDLVDGAGRKTPLGLDSDEIEWIRTHLQCKECSRFKAKPEAGGEDKCYCGYKSSQHIAEALNNPRPDDPWNEETHTRRKPTNAYGDIEFVGFGQKIGKYVRVDNDTSTDSMLKLMIDHWKLEAPNLLISVTGGAKNFHMKPRLKEVFRRGLMKAAQSTGAWITTGGTHVGVMKHVGEAVRDYGLAQTSQKKVTAIGIATWGCIQHKAILINEDGTGKWPARYRQEDLRMKRETPLDSNHSHFILVDNGTQHQFGVEIPFRAKLENAIAHMTAASGSAEDAIKVPIVLLVLEGGPGTLETVYSSIQNATPAVIVEGSGRAADILAFAYQNAHEEEILAVDKEGKQSKKIIMGMDAQTEAEVTQMIKDEFGEKNYNTHVGRVKECLQNPDLLTIFNLDVTTSSSSKDVDIAILQAMLKANKDQVMDQLRLALAWNRIDVAKSEIFTDERDWETGSLDDIMLSAILLDRTDFVKLFLENGVSLREFLTIKRLLQLYNQIPKKCQLYSLLQRTKPKLAKYVSLENVAHLIKSLMGDFYEPFYLRVKKYQYIDVQGIMEGEDVTMISPQRPGDEYGHRISNPFKRPERELFIWSVLMNRPDMAKLFWEEGKECIPSALVANKLLKSLQSYTEDSDLESKLQKHAVEFEDLAIGVLNECYEADEKRTLSLLVRELYYWGNATCVLIAVEADNKRFISQSACQALLNIIWMGQMSKETKIWRLLLCVIFPPLLFGLIRFERLEKSRLDDPKFATDEVDHVYADLRLKRQATKMSVLTRHSAKHTNEPPVRDSSDLTVGEKLWFFFNAPVITFCYNVISYFAFLLLYSYILLVVFSPTLSNSEVVLIVWVFTIFVEELRQVITQSSTTVGTKLNSYIRDMWNLVDVLTIFLFIVGMILRSISNYHTFEAARVILALNILTFFTRLLHIFSVHKQLGPKLVMIGRMVVDLLYFVVILVVIIVGYGVASQAILYPNTELGPTIIIDVLRKAYWQMFGELFLEEIEGQDQCTFDYALYSNNTLPRCPTAVATIVVPILLGFYMLLTNVLLLNLLIAMFSYTFQKIQDNTDLHWYFQRYNLIYDYYDRPPLPPPFIIVSHFYLLCVRCLQKCCKVARTSTKATFAFRKIIESSQEIKRLELWEDMNRDEFMRKTQQQEMESMENKVGSTSTRLGELMVRVDELQEQHSSGSSSTGGMVTPMVKMHPQMDRRLAKLEDQMVITFEALDWIVKALSENNMAAKSIKAPVIPNLRQQKQKELKQAEEKAKKEKDLVKMMITKRSELHYKSRQSPYPGSQVRRFPVPDEKVYWEISYDEYSPEAYTSPEVKACPVWAEPVDLMALDADVRPTMSWNQYDKQYKIDRKSLLGKYEIKDGLPLNPCGRTGVTGRGLLGLWGPNHAGDPVVTRWKRDEAGNKVMDHNKPVLEVVAVQREDNRQWAFPGGFCEPGQLVANCLRSEFTQEALGTLVDDQEKMGSIKQKLDTMFSKGEEIYTGYADDPRNTDNAWLETRAVNYHDEDGEVLKFFELRAGSTEQAATWLTVTSRITMHGAHQFILQKLAQKLGCAF